MALLLRYSPEEQVLRSVGSEPNGIVGIEHPLGEPAFMIDPHDTRALVVPRDESGTTVVNEQNADGRDPNATPITIEEAVAACESVDEAQILWRMAGMMVKVDCQHFAEMHHPADYAHEAIDFAAEVMRQLQEAGWLTVIDLDA